MSKSIDHGMANAQSRHLLIAGTGRAGTSLLVRYLTGLGFDTHLSRRGSAADWDEPADAGLEDDLSNGECINFPYVVKSAWSFETIDQIMSRTDVKLDAVIVPVRDLVEAATSRTVIEQQSVHRNAPWMAALDRSWETWATAPGGIVYSLNPLDQARLLAVGFHHLLHRLSEREIPIVLLVFPKFVEEPEYLYRCLRSLLPPDINEEFANEVFEKIVNREKVRIGDEIATLVPTETESPKFVRAYPKQVEIDNIALRREIQRLRQELDHLRGS